MYCWRLSDGEPPGRQEQAGWAGPVRSAHGCGKPPRRLPERQEARGKGKAAFCREWKGLIQYSAVWHARDRTQQKPTHVASGHETDTMYRTVLSATVDASATANIPP